MSTVIRIQKRENHIELRYDPEDFPKQYIFEKLHRTGELKIGRVFFYQKNEIPEYIKNELEDNSTDVFSKPLIFPLGELNEDYYQVPGRRLNIKQDIFFHKDVAQNLDNYRAVRQISIFKILSKLTDQDIYIGGRKSTSIPESDFHKIIASFPNNYELDKYVTARISRVFKDHMETSIDALRSYNDYLNKKIPPNKQTIRKEFNKYELSKYKEVLRILHAMLREKDGYSESNWQETIKEIVLLIYPQYIAAFREAPIFDAKKSKNRSVDFMLVDAGGNIDLLEIKKPSDMAIVTSGLYRDNHIPLRDLSGTIMQIEKYIFHLVRSGDQGEKKLNTKFSKTLPKNISIQVTNPRGLILLGRDNNLTSTQRLDFEVIRRKYKNVVDIITYDDLIRRIETTINNLASEENKN